MPGAHPDPILRGLSMLFYFYDWTDIWRGVVTDSDMIQIWSSIHNEDFHYNGDTICSLCSTAEGFEQNSSQTFLLLTSNSSLLGNRLVQMVIFAFQRSIVGNIDLFVKCIEFDCALKSQEACWRHIKGGNWSCACRTVAWMTEWTRLHRPAGQILT